LPIVWWQGFDSRPLSWLQIYEILCTRAIFAAVLESEAGLPFGFSARTQVQNQWLKSKVIKNRPFAKF
jgi:hypothetical protein